MYRIEVATGEEAVFRTVEELATGIRNGLITPRSRIFHAASQKWLPIEFHPHYKKAVELVTGGAPMIDTGETRVPPAAARRAPVAVPKSAPAPAPTPVPVRPPPTPLPVHDQESPVRPKPMPWESPAPSREPAAAAAPAVVAAPAEVELPRITYPDVASPEPAEAPHPVARRRSSGRGSTLLGGLATLAVLGGWFALRSNRTISAEAAPPPAEQAPASTESEFGDEPAFPEEAPVSPAAAAEPPPAPRTPPARAPARKAEPPRAAARTDAPGASSSSAQLPRPAGPVSQAWSSSAGAIAVTPSLTPPAASPAAASPVITPPPAVLDLSVGKLPSGDSLAPGVTTRDSGAISRILKAVNSPAGTKKTSR